MDDRKRTLVADDQSSEQLKRLRPEDILGTLKDDTSRVATRMVLNKSQFSKVIGKAGQMIANMRSASGSSMRGMDLDAESRLLLIVGTLDQVVLAVDLVIQQALRSSGQASAASGAYIRDTIAVTLLVEHSKVGKVVGVKGSTLQLLKQKSGAVIGVEKDPVELSGVVLRKVLLEGPAGAVRWAHYLMHELFVEPHVAASALRLLSSGGSSHTSTAAALAPPPSLPPTFPGPGPGIGPAASASSSYMPYQQQQQQQHHQNQYEYLQRNPAAAAPAAGGTPSRGGADPMAMSAFSYSLPTPAPGSAVRRGDSAVVFSPQPPVHAQQMYHFHQAQQPMHQQFPPVTQQQQQMHPVYQQMPSPYQQCMQPAQLPYYQDTLPPAQLPLLHMQPTPAHAHRSYSSSGGGGNCNGHRMRVASPVVPQICDVPARSEPLHTNGSNDGHGHDPRSGRWEQAHDQRHSRQGQEQHQDHSEHNHQQHPHEQQHIAMSSLRPLGVPAEVVGQLVYLQAYLLRSFGLVLSITRELPVEEGSCASNGIDHSHRLANRTDTSHDHHGEHEHDHANAHAIEQHGGSAEGAIALRKAANGNDVYLPIPCSCVGGIIGKGGRMLKELQAEFGVRVYVEKEEYLGQRIVRLSYVGPVPVFTSAASAPALTLQQATSSPLTPSTPNRPTESNAAVNRSLSAEPEEEDQQAADAVDNSHHRSTERLGKRGLSRGQFAEMGAKKHDCRDRDTFSRNQDVYNNVERSRSGSLSLGALDRDLQIEGDTDGAEGVDGDGELRDKFLELEPSDAYRSSAFMSINMLHHRDGDGMHNANQLDTRIKTKRPASASDAESEYTTSSVSTKGRVKAGGAAKHKRNRTDGESAATAAAIIGSRSPLKNTAAEGTVDGGSNNGKANGTSTFIQLQLASQQGQTPNQGLQGRSNKSKRGYASEGEGCDDRGDGDGSRRDNRKSIRISATSVLGESPTWASAGYGGGASAASSAAFVTVGSVAAVLPGSESKNAGDRRVDLGDIASQLQLLSQAPKQFSSRSFDAASPATDLWTKDGVLHSRSRNRSACSSDAGSGDDSRCSELHVDTGRSKRKRNSDQSPRPLAGQSSTSDPPPEKLLARTDSAQSRESSHTDAQAMALQRCKERIEAMMEDILQRQVRDVGNNDP